MERRLLTQKDLAARWQVTTKTLNEWRNQGILQPVKGLPSIRFTPEHIAELEGVELNRFSPLERKRMERELEELRAENRELKEIISNILSNASRVIPM